MISANITPLGKKIIIICQMSMVFRIADFVTFNDSRFKLKQNNDLLNSYIVFIHRAASNGIDIEVSKHHTVSVSNFFQGIEVSINN